MVQVLEVEAHGTIADFDMARREFPGVVVIGIAAGASGCWRGFAHGATPASSSGRRAGGCLQVVALLADPALPMEARRAVLRHAFAQRLQAMEGVTFLLGNSDFVAER